MDFEENKMTPDASSMQQPDEPKQPDEQAELAAAKEKRREQQYETFTMLHDLVYILAAITLIFVFFFRLVGVDGSSMYPTLVDHDYLVLESNFLYRNVKQGDIVVIKAPDEAELDGPIVKRVIATENQTVDIDFAEGTVYVDGEALQESYIFEPTYLSYAEYGMAMDYPVTVPEGCIFVMGDNRNHSKDSRSSDVGCVQEASILGKVLLLIFPGRQTNEYGQITGARAWSRLGAIS